MVSLTKALVELDDQIMLASIIEMGKVKEVYMRPLVPLMNESRSSELALQTTSDVHSSEGAGLYGQVEVLVFSHGKC